MEETCPAHIPGNRIIGRDRRDENGRERVQRRKDPVQVHIIWLMS